MPPKKKAQKMALADFFADTTSGSWADDMPELPTAPAARDPTLPRRGEPGYLDSMPDRGARSSFQSGPPREELPLPTVPPYTAFIGNLTFETFETELREFFADLTPASVRLVKDATGKPKGFGYVEFSTVEKLKDALGRSMMMMGGRTIRISVAEAPASSRRDGFGPSAADDAGQWRRTTPLPARTDAPPIPQRGGSFSAEPGPERDWGSTRGTRFVPSATPLTPSGLRRESSGPGRERECMSSAADEVNQWRSAKPMVEPTRGGGKDAPPHQRPSLGPGQSSPSLAEAESTWSRGTKLRTPVPETPATSITDSPGDDREWRSSRATSAVPSAGSRQGSVDGESPRQAPAPLERRKLNLAARSVPPTPSTTASSESGSDSKGIFGSAKPIDSAAREQDAAAKLAQRDEGRKKAREEEIAKAKEEEAKARQFSGDRPRAIREAQEEAGAEVAGPTSPGAGRGERPRNMSGERPRNVSTHQRRPSNDSKLPNPPLSPSVESGFEGTVARGPKPGPREQNGQVEKKKDKPARAGFSFAAAAAGGLLDEDEGEEEWVSEETNGDVNGVNGVTEKVGEVEL